MTHEFFSYFSAVLASAFGGFFIAHLAQLKKAKEELNAKVEEFAEITRKASEANLSLASQLIEIGHRLDTIDAWRSIMGPASSPQPTGWKN